MAVIVNCGITTGDLAYSLPTDLYIANYLVWKSPSDDEKMKQWLRKAYAKVDTVTSGIYVADYDASQRETPVLKHEFRRLTSDNDAGSMGEMENGEAEIRSPREHWQFPKWKVGKS
jgi:hypothetical protein